jgi:hypothetical protein
MRNRIVDVVESSIMESVVNSVWNHVSESVYYSFSSPDRLDTKEIISRPITDIVERSVLDPIWIYLNDIHDDEY